MKIITQTFIVFIALLILPSALFAQSKSITSEDYYAALRKAESKTDKQIRKVVQIQKLYDNGKITGTLTGISEELPPDKSRWTYVDDRPDFGEKTEGITVGNFAYRKENDGAWVKEKKDMGFGISGPGGDDGSTREFFIEDAKIGKEKFRVLVEKTINPNKTRFEEQKTWINEKGLIVKSASITSLNELKNIISTVDVTYDYKIKPPKIEPPVK